jgi:glycosyltransferase involved in cell wall biosynthesis
MLNVDVGSVSGSHRTGADEASLRAEHDAAMPAVAAQVHVSASAAVAAKPLRVLIVSDEMEVGGSQRQIAGLLRAFPPVQCRAELAYFRNPSFLVDDIEHAGIRVHRIDKRSRRDVRFLLRLARLLREGRFDVVHCFSFTAELWIRLALLFAPGAALVASMRDMGHALTPLQWRIKRGVCRSARAVISNSAQAADRIRDVMRGGPPVHVIANGIDMPPALDAARRQALREEMGAIDDRTLALFVGRLAQQKNVDLLLDAMAMLPRDARPRIALAGHGPLRESLEARALSLDLSDDVRFLGERRDARELMQAADVLVLPSRDEGQSNVVLEAMAAGCAVLATRVGGNVALIEDDISGALFDCSDVAALRVALQRAAGDLAWCRRLGAAARARVADRYSLDTLACETLAVYRQCLR